MTATVELKRKSLQIRMDLLRIIHRAKMGHTGGSLSNTDVLTTLYYSVMRHDPKNPKWQGRDRFIASKGHSVESLWCILADLGYFPKEELETYCQFGTRLIGHPNNKVPGIEMNTGALGHGLSVSVGMALAGKKDQRDYRVFCLMGDGEQAEGSVWEAAMAGAHYGLDNLIGMVDRNRLQISGSTEDVMGMDPLDSKWEAFGWRVEQIDGHDFGQLQRSLSQAPQEKGKPTMLILNTVKGKGISFAENRPEWHHHVPNDEQLRLAIEELEAALGALAPETERSGAHANHS
ncbi:transketolase [Paenibacillus sepulcri]